MHHLYLQESSRVMSAWQSPHNLSLQAGKWNTNVTAASNKIYIDATWVEFPNCCLSRTQTNCLNSNYTESQNHLDRGRLSGSSSPTIYSCMLSSRKTITRSLILSYFTLAKLFLSCKSESVITVGKFHELPVKTFPVLVTQCCLEWYPLKCKPQQNHMNKKA